MFSVRAVDEESCCNVHRFGGNLSRCFVGGRGEADQRLEIAAVTPAHGVVPPTTGRSDPSSTIVRQIHALQPRGVDPVVVRGARVFRSGC